MRRSERKITESKDFTEILEAAHTCHLSFNTPKAPYIVPLSFGYLLENNNLTLYFHCAPKGLKLDLMAQCPDVGFEMDCNQALRIGTEACQYSTFFMSIIGWGTLEKVDDMVDKEFALNQIMAHYSNRSNWDFNKKALAHTTVLKLSVKEFTGKANRKEQQ